MDLENIMQKGKAAAKAILKRIAKEIAKKLFKKLLAKVLLWLSPYLLVLLALIIVVGGVWGVFAGNAHESQEQDGQLTFFAADANPDSEWTLEKDKKLLETYKDLSQNGSGDGELSFGSKNGNTHFISQYDQASMYSLSWALIAAADRMINNPDSGEIDPKPNEIYAKLGPKFTWKQSIATITECKTVEVKETKRNGDDIEDYTTRSETKCETSTVSGKLLTVVQKYDEKSILTYKTETTVTGTAPNTTTVVKEVFAGIETEKLEINRLETLMVDYGYLAEDSEFVTELAKQYDETFANYEYGGDYLADSGYVSSQVPSQYVAIYKAASKKYGIPWNILAAVHSVETTFSTDKKMVSSVGAIGPMQFMPATWVGWKYNVGDGLVSESLDLTSLSVIRAGEGYGVDANGDGKADPWNLEDAVYSAANYLNKNGFRNDPRNALWMYNHADWYVDKVLQRADLFGQSSVKLENFIAPVDNYRISSPFGERFHPIKKVYKLHKGTDLAAPQGTPIKAPAAGVVITATWMSGYGNTVIIDHGNGTTTLYGHIREGGIFVTVGQKVIQGEKIAEVGSTGGSTGPHLHYELQINGKLVDPQKHVKL